MENKKTKIAIVIVILIILLLILISFFFNNFNTKQVTILTEEANKILELKLKEDNIDFEIKTEKNYAEVEKSIKEYISKLKNIYLEMEEMVSGINPNSIFSAQNMPDRNFDMIDNIISEYKDKSQNFISEYQELITKEKIMDGIDDADISIRKEYYINLYNEVMLSETMQRQYNQLEDEIKNEKGRLYDKLNKIEKMKVFLEKNENTWMIKNEKIIFTNLNQMTEYYNLFNQVID